MAFEIYDDVAFFWFTLTWLFVFLVPFTWHMIKLFRNGDIAQAEVSTEFGRKKWKAISSERAKMRKQHLLSMKTAIFVALWAIFLYGVYRVPDYRHEELQSFDPYDVLGLQVGATTKEIKRAYRDLSLKYHPDKNPNDPKAANQFMKISKAHLTLTDEVTRGNWEKYGNPDGYQGTSITIGLPSWLLNPKNELTILIIYFGLIVIIPPILVGIWWGKNSHLVKGIELNTLRYFQYYIASPSRSHTPKTYLDVLCSAEEFMPHKKKLWISPAAVQSYRSLKLELGEDIPRHFTKLDHAELGMVCLCGHMLRAVKNLHPNAKDYLNHILKSSHKLMAMMLEMAASPRRGPNDTIAWPKFETCRDILVLSQLIVQAIYFDESSLYQLPHLSVDLVQEFRRNKKSRNPISKASQLAEFTPEQRRELVLGLTDAQWDDIDRVLNLLPDVQMDVRHEVEDEADVWAGDVMQFVVSLARRPESLANVEKPQSGEKPLEQDADTLMLKAKGRREKIKKQRNLPPVEVHAPFFPEKKFERWLVLLVDENDNLIAYQKVPSLAEPQDVTLFYVPNEPGNFTFTVHVLCDSYLGCDKSKTVNFQVLSRPESTAKDVTLKDDDEGAELEKEDEPERWMVVLDYVVSAAFLGFIGLGLYTYASQKPWFQEHVEPFIQRGWAVIRPITSKFSFITDPIGNLWEEYVAPLLYVEQSQPVKIDPEKFARLRQTAGLGGMGAN